MSKDICIISYIYDPRIKGDMGGHRKVWALARALIEEGSSVRVFVPDFEQVPATIDARIVVVPVTTVDMALIRPLSFSVRLFRALRQQAAERRPGVIYCRPIVSLVPLIAARLLKAKLICEVNGDPYEGAGMFRRLVMRLVYSITYTRADHIVVLTGRLKYAVMNTYHIVSQKISVLESAAESDVFFPKDRGRCRQSVGLDPAAFVAGFIGTLMPYQGIHYLIEAMPFILEAVPHAHLLIVGEGMMRETWETEVFLKDLKEQVTFTGQVSYSDAPIYINAMDVCLAPLDSLRGEASPLKIYDCLACGRPMVVSDISPLKDLLDRAQGIVRVRPDDPKALADAVIALARDPEQRSRLGAAGRTFIERGNTWRLRARELRAVCDRLV